MKEIIVSVFVIFALCGCSSAPTESKADNGTPKTSSTPAANDTPKQLTVTAEDLRAPFFPGATINVDSALKVKTDTEESVAIEMKSVDDIETIIKFYEEKVKGLKFNPFTKDSKDHFMGEADVDGGKLAIELKADSGFVIIKAAFGKS